MFCAKSAARKEKVLLPKNIREVDGYVNEIIKGRFGKEYEVEEIMGVGGTGIQRIKTMYKGKQALELVYSGVGGLEKEFGDAKFYVTIGWSYKKNPHSGEPWVALGRVSNVERDKYQNSKLETMSKKLAAYVLTGLKKKATASKEDQEAHSRTQESDWKRLA